MKFIMKKVLFKKTVKKNFFSADIHLGVTKMIVICQQMIILLQLCTDMIDITLTFHLKPNTSHLEHIQHCYEVINPKIKFWQRSNLRF